MRWLIPVFIALSAVAVKAAILRPASSSGSTPANFIAGSGANGQIAVFNGTGTVTNNIAATSLSSFTVSSNMEVVGTGAATYGNLRVQGSDNTPLVSWSDNGGTRRMFMTSGLNANMAEIDSDQAFTLLLNPASTKGVNVATTTTRSNQVTIGANGTNNAEINLLGGGYSSGDEQGRLIFDSAGNSCTSNGMGTSEIRSEQDGSNAYSSRVTFFTTSNGACANPIERMRIDNAGLVAIGSTTTNGQLNVENDQNAGTNMFVANNNPNSSASTQLRMTSDVGQLRFITYPSGATGNQGGVAKAKLKVIEDNSTSGNSGGLLINTASTQSITMSVNGSIAESITNGALVGIGTGSPCSSCALHIPSSANGVSIQDTAMTNPALAVVSGSTNAIFSGHSELGGGINSQDGEIQLGNLLTNAAMLQYSSGGNTVFSIDNTFNSANAKTQFRMRTDSAANVLIPMTILGSGNIGVANSAPATIFDVTGFSSVRGQFGVNTSTADNRSVLAILGQGSTSATAFSNVSGTQINILTNTPTTNFGQIHFGDSAASVYDAEISVNKSSMVFVGPNDANPDLTIVAGGKIGVATSKPATLFHISSGTLTVDGNVNPAMNLNVTGTAPAATFTPNLSSNTVSSALSGTFTNTTLGPCISGSTISLTLPVQESVELNVVAVASGTALNSVLTAGVLVDGAFTGSETSARGFASMSDSLANDGVNISFPVMVPALSAATHNFCLTLAITSGGGTGTIDSVRSITQLQAYMLP